MYSYLDKIKIVTVLHCYTNSFHQAEWSITGIWTMIHLSSDCAFDDTLPDLQCVWFYSVHCFLNCITIMSLCPTQAVMLFTVSSLNYMVIYKIGKDIHPICRRCLNGNETVEHLLCECESLTISRERIFGQSFGELQQLSHVPADLFRRFVTEIGLAGK